MKIWIALAVAALVGLSAGVVTAVAKFRMYPWKGVYWTPSDEERGLVLGAIPTPRAVVDEEVYHFGVMDANAQGSHDFVFTNLGDAPLELTELETSCKCTVSEIEDAAIPPGGSGKVTVQWNGKGMSGSFRHTATIGTNDPHRERVVLTIEGRLTQATKATPDAINFSRVMVGDDATATVKVFGFHPEKMVLTGYELADPEDADLYEVHYEERPLEEVKQDEEDATSGYLVTVRVKSGLPLGRFRQTIRLKTNYEKASTIEIPVQGRVESEVSLVGSGWSDENSVLWLGRVRREAGVSRTLLIVVGGTHRKGLTFGPIEVVPDQLEVQIGPTKEAKDGSVTTTPVTISVPPGSRPASYLGPSEDQLGRILIKTSHPKVPRIKILVRFVVQG